MKKLITLALIITINVVHAQCWKSVCAGSLHSIGIKTDGTLWGWGWNSFHILGSETRVSSPIQIGNENNWQSVSVRYDSFVAIKTDGTLWAWGSNMYGQLGMDNTSNNTIYTPTQVDNDNNWQSISAGGAHTAGIRTDGTIWTFGKNTYGQLGNGNNDNSLFPIQIGNENDWKLVSPGGSYTLAIKLDGSLWGWGGNQFGQLGDGTYTDKTLPVRIGNSYDWAKISTGQTHSIAIKTDGTLWMWGYNYYGQLGTGDETSRNVPTQIGNSNNWESISGGLNYSICIKTDGTLWACGENVRGQFGDGTNAIMNTQLSQRGIDTNWQFASGGYDHTLALKTDGALSSSGNNGYGQLGNGNTTNSRTFLSINCPTLNTVIQKMNSFTVSPNPIKNLIKIQNIANAEIDNITLINSLGEIILKFHESEINIEYIESGLYILKIDSNGKSYYTKLLKN